jgi:hypothetical protein
MNTKRCLITLMIIIILGAIFGSVLWFGLVLNGAPNAGNLDKWNEYGGFIGGLIGPLLNFLNLLLIVYIAVSLNPSQSKTQLTLDLHREFDSESMWKARTDGGKFVLQNPSQTLDQLNRSDNPGARNIWMVIGFYQRLALAIKNRHIDERLVPELFGDTFIWWFRLCFEKQLEPTGWESWQRMEYLRNWLAKKADLEDFLVWEKRAEKYLTKEE